MCAVFLTFAVICGMGACTTWRQAMRRSSTPHAIYAATHFSGRIVAGTSGQIILLIYCAPLTMSDPHVLEHSHAPGVAMTALSFLLCAMICSRENCQWLLASASNEVQLRTRCS